MLIKSDIRLSRLLERPLSIGELAEEARLSISVVSHHVKGMKENGLVVKRRHGKKVFVQRSTSEHALILWELLREYPKLPFEDLVTHGSLRVLGVMAGHTSITQISLLTGLTRQGVSAIVKMLGRYGVVVRNLGYRVNPSHLRIKAFVDSYYGFLNRKIASSLAADASVLWQRGEEFLFKSSAEVRGPNVRPTSVSVFHEYGVPLITKLNYYCYSARELDINDHIIHTILTDPRNPTYNSYAMLLYQKTAPKGLPEKAALYSLEEHVKTLMDFLGDRRKVSDFTPAWEDYSAMAEAYEVA